MRQGFCRRIEGRRGFRRREQRPAELSTFPGSKRGCAEAGASWQRPAASPEKAKAKPGPRRAKRGAGSLGCGARPGARAPRTAPQWPESRAGCGRCDVHVEVERPHRDLRRGRSTAAPSCGLRVAGSGEDGRPGDDGCAAMDMGAVAARCRGDRGQELAVAGVTLSSTVPLPSGRPAGTTGPVWSRQVAAGLGRPRRPRGPKPRRPDHERHRYFSWLSSLQPYERIGNGKRRGARQARGSPPTRETPARRPENRSRLGLAAARRFARKHATSAAGEGPGMAAKRARS